jgi:hypothetical protein
LQVAAHVLTETFFLSQKKRKTEHGIIAMLLGPAFSASGRPRGQELREQGEKLWHSQSHCTSSAQRDDSETFFLPQKKRKTEHGIIAMLLGPAFTASGRPRGQELREQGKKLWHSQRNCTSLKTVQLHLCWPCPFSLKRNENQIFFANHVDVDAGNLS